MVTASRRSGTGHRTIIEVNNHAVDALAEQLTELIALVDALPDPDFSRPSRCPGWSVAELVAHCEGMLRNRPMVRRRSTVSATTGTSPTRRARERTQAGRSPRSFGTG